MAAEPLIVKIADRLVKIMEEVSAGGDQAIDEAILDHADHQPPHSGRHLAPDMPIMMVQRSPNILFQTSKASPNCLP